MRKLTYENTRGVSIEFYLSPLLIESLTGIGEVDADVQSQKSPYQDGDTYIDTILEPRFINLEGSIVPTDLKAIKEYRSHITSVCNPKLGEGTLTLELDGSTHQIKGALDGVPVFPERRNGIYQKFMMTWKCSNPYWKSVEMVSEPMTAYIGLFEFPIQFPTQMGEVGTKSTFINEGDVETPIQIEFRGPATKPKVENLTTGEFIKVNRQLSENDTLIVETTFGNKRVLITDDEGNQTNVLNWIDLDSTFFNLDVGANEIEYTADEGRDNAVVSITWRNRYLGV